MNKRGLSEVVGTILIVLLVIAAIAVVWAVFSGFIGRQTEDIELRTKCFDINLKIEYARWDGTDLTAKIRRNAGDDLNEIRFFVDDRQTFSTKDAGAPPIPNKLESEIYTIPLPSGVTDPTGLDLRIVGVVGEDTICQNTEIKEEITT